MTAKALFLAIAVTLPAQEIVPHMPPGELRRGAPRSVPVSRTR